MTHLGVHQLTPVSIFRSQTQALSGFHTITGLGQNEVDMLGVNYNVVKYVTHKEL